MAQVNEMNQIGKISPCDLGNMAASSVKKSTSSNLNFSDVMSASTSDANKDSSNNRVNDSQTSKESYETNKSTCKKFDSQETNKAADADASTSTENVSDVKDVLEETMETVDALKEAIAEVLGVSKEELEEKMAELGMTVMDLLQNDSLKDLVLAVNNISDMTELLTNESLCNQLADVLKTVEEFVETADLELFSQAAATLETQDFSKALDKNMQTEDVEVSADKGNVETSEEPILTVQRETETDFEENTRGNDSREDNTNVESQFNQFLQNLSDSVQDIAKVPMNEVERLQQMQEIVDQVVERIKVTLSQDTKSMELQLNPENLGKVNVSVIAKNGEMTASFTVENQLAKEALESQLMVLKENLNEQGIKVDVIEVTVAQQGLSQNDFSNQSQQNFQKKAKNSNHIRKIQKEEEEAGEEADSVPIIQENGTVDFSA